MKTLELTENQLDVLVGGVPPEVIFIYDDSGKVIDFKIVS